MAIVPLRDGLAIKFVQYKKKNKVPRLEIQCVCVDTNLYAPGGVQCPNHADGEDGLCDDCRVRGHSANTGFVRDQIRPTQEDKNEFARS